jgi:hypothetical protein
VFKKGDPLLPRNYRPISLLSVFDKLLEKLMHCRLYKYLQLNKVLYKFQFGFKPVHSTSLALIDVIDNLYKNLDACSKVCGIYLDLQKAFDSVSHDILLEKIYIYGVRGIVYDRFESYLYNRKQYTCVGNTCSDVQSNKFGVPQGSVLGPLLFLIYVNDIGKAVPNETVKLFADDTNLFIYDADIVMLNDRANHSICELHRFLANKLSLNLSKTCFMVFPAKNDDKIKIIVNGIELCKVTECKYLGVTLDHELKWAAHIEQLYKKLVKFIGIFYKLRNKLPPAVLKIIYFTFVYSHILYGVEVYANTHMSYLDKLIKLNNKILRILQNKPLLTPVRELYASHNTLPINDLHSMQILILVHKFLYHQDKLPEAFRNYFVINTGIHCYNTRIKEDIHVACSKLSIGHKCLKAKAGSLWNALPSYLKNNMSTGVFKYKICNYLMSML